MSDRFAKCHGTSWDTATPNIQINAGAEEFVTRTQGASDLELESLGSALFTHSNYIGFVLTKRSKSVPNVQWTSKTHPKSTVLLGHLLSAHGVKKNLNDSSACVGIKRVF